MRTVELTAQDLDDLLTALNRVIADGTFSIDKPLVERLRYLDEMLFEIAQEEDA